MHPTLNPAWVASVNTTPPAPGGTSFITGTAGSGQGQFFANSTSQPKLFIGEDCWSILANGGRWSGNYQSTFDTYLSQRAAQGYTAVEVSLFSFTGYSNFAHEDGADWDGTYPFTSTNDPTSGVNAPFWARRDYFFASAAAKGMTVVVNISTPSTNIGAWTASLTTPQWTALGAIIGGRYKNTQNLLWIIGDDYFGSLDTQFTACLTAIRTAGDSHLIAIQNYQESTSRYDIYNGNSLPWGLANAQYNWGYSYNVSYDVVEKSFAEPSPVTTIWGDGFYIAEGTSGITDINLERRMAWWALSSGSRGVSMGDNDIWIWGSGSAAAVTAKPFYTTTVPAFASVYSALPEWWLLVPDTTSALVTSGRGTHATAIVSGGSGTGYTSNTDSYVTASRTPDGKLAVIYMSHASTITIDQTKMAAGYTARWIDPASGAATTVTSGSSYNSGTMGSNSAGDADWALILKGP